MGIYSEFWKKKVDEILKNLKTTEKGEFEIQIPELSQIGDREEYNGYLNCWLGEVIRNTDSSVFNNLKTEIETSKKFKDKILGHLSLRVIDSRILKVDYEPITFELLIRKYIEIQDTLKVQDEIYKWKLIKTYQDNWKQFESKNIDFITFFNNKNFGNLVFHDVYRVYKHILKEKPKEFENLILSLYDESIDLKTRILKYQNGFKDMYYSLNNHGKNTYQDERTCATLLAFRYPEKYPLYKDKFYTIFCKSIGIKPFDVGEKMFHYYDLVKDLINNHIIKNKQILEIKRNKLDESCYPDTNNMILAQDILYTTLRRKDEKKESEEEDDDFENNETLTNTTMAEPLNQILYGPPGTGKTYHTINKSLKIIIDSIGQKKDITYTRKNSEQGTISVSDLKILLSKPFHDSEERSLIMDIFKSFKNNGQIEFVTFHQSFSYEDFIEGIKPVLTSDEEKDLEDELESDSSKIQYELKPGIFKRICARAKGIETSFRSNQKINLDNVRFFKMSLGGKNKPHIHNWCLDNNKIALGWGNDIDFSSYVGIKSWSRFRNKFKNEHKDLVKESKYHIQAIASFLSMEIGDIVVVSKGNNIIDAIGRISGEYKNEVIDGINYYQFRDVEWFAKNMNASPEIFFKKKISQQTIYQFYESDVKKEEIIKLFGNKDHEVKNFVLIIDEINRGNIANIFGELITLIETDKRIGQANELTVRLPYSNDTDDEFGVPNNVFLLGTMNTADRSVEALDTALRRRFVFEEMMPTPELLRNISIEGLDLEQLLATINQRLEVLIDRDHQIGHSYFINCNSIDDLLLAFNNKIIPLLQEYFYGDYGKIGLVLGKAFVEKIRIDHKIFATFDYPTDNLKEESYAIKKYKSGDYEFINALKTLLNNSN